MTALSKPRRIAGWILISLVAAMMLMGASFGLFGTPPPEIKKYGPGLVEFGKLTSIKGS